MARNSPSPPSEHAQLVGSGAQVRLVSTVASVIASMLTTSLLVRVMGEKAYGLVAVLLSVVFLAPSVGQLGLGTATARALSVAAVRRDSEDMDRIGLAALSIGVAGGFVGAVVVFLVSQLIAASEPVGERLLLGGSFALILVSVSVGVITAAIAQGHSRVFGMETPLSAGTILRCLAVVVLAVAGLSSIRSVAIAFATSAATSLLISAAIVRRVLHLRSSVLRPRMRDVRRLLRAATPFMASGIATLVIARLDVALLGVLKGTAAVGSYEPTLKVVDALLIFIPMLFQGMYLPVATRLLAAGDFDQVAAIYVTVSKITYAAAFPVVLVLVLAPEPVLTTLFGSQFSSSPVLVWILAVGYVVNLSTGLNWASLAAGGTRNDLLVTGAIGASVMFASAAILIPLYGAYGAAVATTVSYVATNASVTLALWRRTGIHLFRADVGRLVASSFVLLAVALPFRRTVGSSLIVTLVAVGIASAAWSLFLLWTRTLSRNEVAPYLLRRRHSVDALDASSSPELRSRAASVSESGIAS